MTQTETRLRPAQQFGGHSTPGPNAQLTSHRPMTASAKGGLPHARLTPPVNPLESVNVSLLLLLPFGEALDPTGATVGFEFIKVGDSFFEGVGEGEDKADSVGPVVVA